MNKAWLLTLVATVLCGCSSTRWPMTPATLTPLDGGRVAMQSEQLAACNSDAGDTPVIDPQRPLTVIVHGCRSSGGQYGALARVFREQGQQAVCFNYDDRDSITRSASQLGETLRRLVMEAGVSDITLIGHSQGGLVGRHALVKGSPLGAALHNHPARLRLVTVSTPFGGIKAASHCGSRTLAVLSLGLTIPICQAVTGSKWREIPPTSRFIQAPGELLPEVASHLKIVTWELGSCRKQNADGSCSASDDVFSVEEQRQTQVDLSPPSTERVVAAGHVEIVGDAQRVPWKLISILQQESILLSTLPALQFATRVHDIYEAEP